MVFLNPHITLFGLRFSLIFLNPPPVISPLFLITISIIALILVERAMLDQIEYVCLVFDKCLLIAFYFFF